MNRIKGDVCMPTNLYAINAWLVRSSWRSCCKFYLWRFRDNKNGLWTLIFLKLLRIIPDFFYSGGEDKSWGVDTLSKGLRTQLFVRTLCNHSCISTSLAEELWKMRKTALSLLFGTLSSDGFELYLLVMPVLDAVRMYALLVLSFVNIWFMKKQKSSIWNFA